jgi:hypothetical protein
MRLNAVLRVIIQKQTRNYTVNHTRNSFPGYNKIASLASRTFSDLISLKRLDLGRKCHNFNTRGYFCQFKNSSIAKHLVKCT